MHNRPSNVIKLLDAVTSATAGPVQEIGDESFSGVNVQATGGWTATITFQGSLDGVNFQNISVSDSDATDRATSVATLTAPGAGELIFTPKFIRASTTAYTSGTVTVLAEVKY